MQRSWRWIPGDNAGELGALSPSFVIEHQELLRRGIFVCSFADNNAGK